MAQLTCSACGATLPPGAMFCGECGRSVSPAALNPAQPPPASNQTPRDDRRSTPSAPRTRPAAGTPSEPWTSPPPVHPQPMLIAPTPSEHTDNPYATGDLSGMVDPTGSIRNPEAIRTADTTDLSGPLAAVPLAEAGREDASRPARTDAADGQPACEACGATMGAHDIFCGECGHVSGMVSRNFGRDPAVIERAASAVPVSAAAVPVVAAPVSVSAAPSSADDDLEATRIVSPTRAGQRFILQFSTGESVTAHGSGLVGRNPIAEPGEYFDQLVRVIDPTRSVSKTHLEFGQDAGSFWVRDRFSGNGSILREPDSPAKRCDPGKRYPVLRGTRIDLGEQFVIVS